MPVDVELAGIRKRLAGREQTRFVGEVQRWAAVALVLREESLGTELLLIKRADRAGDPWSGHMALPGGHREADDADLLATAMRETREEVGLDLREHELLGALDEHPVTLRDRFMGMAIAPFVFMLRGPVQLEPNDEVAELLWAPLGQLGRGEVDVIKELQWEGQTVRLPAYGVGNHQVWGLTHRMLENFFATLGREV